MQNLNNVYKMHDLSNVYMTYDLNCDGVMGQEVVYGLFVCGQVDVVTVNF